MVRHIVMFKLTEFATPADKLAKMQEIKTGLEAVDRQDRCFTFDPCRFQYKPRRNLGRYPDYRTRFARRCKD